MSQEKEIQLLTLEDLLSREHKELLDLLSPGIGWALDSLVVSFSEELKNLDPSAREAFARITLGYGSTLTNFMSLAHHHPNAKEKQEIERKKTLLRGLDIYEDLNDFDLGQIASAFRTVHYSPGEFLAHQGEEGQAVFFLERGMVGVVVDGNQVAIRGEGSLFGETSCITGDPVSASLRAVSSCEVLEISREEFDRRVLKLPEILPKIARIGFSRLDEATQRLSEVYHHMPDALMKINREGLITGDVSSKCFAFLEQDSLTGKDFSKLFFKDAPGKVRAWKEGLPLLWDNPSLFDDPSFDFPSETDFQTAGGDYRHYTLHIYPSHIHGERVGFDVAISDQTEKKRIEEERERIEASLRQQKRQYLVMRLGTEQMGLAIEKVREIIDMREMTVIPNTPVHVRGVFNLRGGIIPALDLRVMLGWKPNREAENCIFVVDVEVEGQNRPLGLIVDDVSDIVEVLENEIDKADFGTLGKHTRYLGGIAKQEGRVHLLLDVDGLLSSEDIKILRRLERDGR